MSGRSAGEERRDRRVTIDDVARMANVHKATVSRALNVDTQHQVSQETVKKVKKTASQLGYRPNAMARSLRTSLSMTIGVIIPDLTNPFFPPVIRGIEDYLQPRGYTALLANTDGHEEVERAAIDSLLERRVDGLIVASGHHGEQPVLAGLHEGRVPVVMLNRDAGGLPFPLVTGNDASGVVASVAHLYELGHREILHIAGPLDLSTSIVRKQAFEHACAAHPDVRATVVEAAGLNVDAGQHAMDAIASRADTDLARRATAIVASNDLIAIGVLRSLRSQNVRCPDDISVIGFNGITFAEDFSPPLTTVRVPAAELGSAAARLLLEGIQGDGHETVTMMLPVSLIVRASTGPVRV